MGKSRKALFFLTNFQTKPTIKQMKKPKIYLANPYGFTESTRKFMYEKLTPRVKDLGFKVINPWDIQNKKEIAKTFASAEKLSTNRAKKAFNKIWYNVGKRNQGAIDESDAVVAVLEGQELDAGICAEVGYAFAKGKKVFGYREDLRQSGEFLGKISAQVQYFVEASTGKIAENLDELEKLLKRYKTSF
jgi:nucleoside 2-deoxyribosyltransferase